MQMNNKIIEELQYLVRIMNDRDNKYLNENYEILPFLYSLYANHLNINPMDYMWINRDRVLFLLENCMPALYAILFMSGYNISYNDVLNYSNKYSKLSIYPEINNQMGIDMFMSLNSEEFLTSLGISFGENYYQNLLAEKTDNHGLINYKIYIFIEHEKLCSSKILDIIEKTKYSDLKNLVIVNVISKNSILKKKYLDIRNIFNVKKINDCCDISEIDKVLNNINSVKNNPILIELFIDKKISSDNIITEFDENLMIEFRAKIKERLQIRYLDWLNYKALNDENTRNVILNDFVCHSKSRNLLDINKEIINYIKQKSFDVVLYNDVCNIPMTSNNLLSISNGISLSGLRSIYIDKSYNLQYLFPQIKIVSTFNINTILIFTYDTYHRFGELFSSQNEINFLQNIDNFSVYTPFNYSELIYSWNSILKKSGPCCLILPKIDTDLASSQFINGGYVLSSTQNIQGVLVASGVDVIKALEIKEMLEIRNVFLRVVSIPNYNDFLDTDIIYQNDILPISVKRIILTSGINNNLSKLVYSNKYVINIKQVKTNDEIIEKILELLEKI